MISNIFYVQPSFGENDPIWRAYFSDGLVQPPTSSEGIICHQHPTSNSIQFLAFLRQVAPATTLWWMDTVGKSGWKGFSLLDDCYSRGIGRESLGIPHHLGIRNVVSSWLVRLWTANCNHNEVLTWVSHRNHPPPPQKKKSFARHFQVGDTLIDLVMYPSECVQLAQLWSFVLEPMKVVVFLQDWVFKIGSNIIEGVLTLVASYGIVVQSDQVAMFWSNSTLRHCSRRLCRKWFVPIKSMLSF